jgi:hypothetical protein
LIKDNNLDKAEGDATPSFVFGMNPTALSLFLSLSRSLCFFLEALQWLPLLHDPASDRSKIRWWMFFAVIELAP